MSDFKVGYTSIQEEKCHEGVLKVFLDPKSPLVFYAGGANRGVYIPKGYLLLDVGCGYSEPVVVFSNKKEFPRSVSLAETMQYESMQIPWKDWGSPNLSKAFWEMLIADLRELAEKRKELNVVIACVGGHGRTGTALAVLAGLMGATTTDPVDFIRKGYCKKAVESVSQLDYVEAITGIKVIVGTPPITVYPTPTYQGTKSVLEEVSKTGWTENAAKQVNTYFQKLKEVRRNKNKKLDLFEHPAQTEVTFSEVKDHPFHCGCKKCAEYYDVKGF